MKKDQTYYPGGYSQVKTDTKILRKVFMGHGDGLSDNELKQAGALLDLPNVTREQLLALEDDPMVERTYKHTKAVRGQLQEWNNTYDEVAKQADASVIESVRPRQTRLTNEIDVLNAFHKSIQPPPKKFVRGADRGGQAPPMTEKKKAEAEARFKEMFPELDPAEAGKILQQKRDELVALKANTQLTLMKFDQLSGHSPDIPAEFRRGNTPEMLDLLPPLAMVKDISETLRDTANLNRYQEAILQGKDSPLTVGEAAQVNRFLIGLQQEGKASRNTVGIMNGVADMYPYALAIATGTSLVGGGRKALLSAAGTSVKKRAGAHALAYAGASAVATGVSTPAIIDEGLRKSVDLENVQLEMNTESGQALVKFLDPANPAIDDVSKNIFESYWNNFAENLTEGVGGGIARTTKWSKMALGRGAMAAGVKKMNKHVSPELLETIMLRFQKTMSNRHLQRTARVLDAVVSGNGKGKLMGTLSHIGFDGLGGELFEESVAGMKDTLLELGVADGDKSALTLAQKLFSIQTYDPTQGGDLDDWIVLMGTIGLPGTLRSGVTLHQMYSERQTAGRAERIQQGKDVLTLDKEKDKHQRRVDSAERKVAQTEAFLAEDREIPVENREGFKKILTQRLNEYADALYAQQVSAAEMQKTRESVIGMSERQREQVFERLGKMEQAMDQPIRGFAYRRIHGYESSKEFRDTIRDITLGLNPIRVKKDKSPRATSTVRGMVADVVRGYARPVTKKRGGIVHMSRILHALNPSMYNRLKYHELGHAIRTAEQKALKSKNFNTDAEALDAMEKAGRDVVMKALDRGFFPLATVKNKGHRKLLLKARQELKVYEDDEKNRYTTIDETSWEKFTPLQRRILSRYLTRIIDVWGPTADAAVHSQKISKARSMRISGRC
ncbi:MAG: hypothetical protein ACYS76_16585 [Planctomycetota bacterium]|jgi:hypothetical protein